jgi:urocanate hydratase
VRRFTEIQQQIQDNIKWIKGAQENKLVVGSGSNTYADAEGRVKTAEAFNQLRQRRNWHRYAW